MNDETMLLPHIKLRFNIEHPNLEDYYVHGYECATADLCEDENPCQPGSQASEHWLEGWWAGFYEEPPAYELTTTIDEVAIETQDAANDLIYHHEKESFLITFLEITGVIALSAIVGYQLLELVA